MSGGKFSLNLSQLNNRHHFSSSVSFLKKNFFFLDLFKFQDRDFPGGPEVKAPCFHGRGVQFPSLVRKLRSHMLNGSAKNNNDNKNQKPINSSGGYINKLK